MRFNDSFSLIVIGGVMVTLTICFLVFVLILTAGQYLGE
jgi:hypothetical protein